MIARAMGLRAHGDLPAARTEINDAYKTLLGPQSDLLRMLDPVSAARLIGHPKKLETFADLTSAEAALAGEAGNQQSQNALLARAKALAEEAAKLQ
jgi:hypothetical protein